MPGNGRFATLDGMRGLAALVVAWAHVGELLGLALPPHSELAVDFFFVLSGFVIAQAYEERLASSMGLLEFIKIRVIRLHPLLMLGCAISLAVLALDSASGNGNSPGSLAWAAIAAIFLIPLHSLDSPGAFPLDGPAWSLFAEYWVNILFALIAPFLTFVRLRALMLLGILMLMLLFVLEGGIGNVWQTKSVGLSILRVTYPFFAGVMMSSLYRSGKLLLPTIPPLASLTLLSAILLSPAVKFDMAFEIAMIVLVFPLLVIASTNDRMPAAQHRLMLLGGALSYPVYTLHFPLALALFMPFVGTGYSPAATVGLLSIYMFGLCGLSYLALRHFDEPVRAWLGTRLLSRKRQTLAA